MFKAIIGCIISVISEKALSHLFDNFWNSFFSGNNIVTDWIYTRIAEGTTVNLSFYLFVVLGIYIVKKIGERDNESQCNPDECNNRCGSCDKSLIRAMHGVIARRLERLLQGKEKRDKIFKIIKIGLVVVLFVTFLTLTNYINHNVVRIRNNIDIASPFVSTEEYNELKSMYYTMRSRNDYDHLCAKLDIIARDNQLVLQK